MMKLVKSMSKRWLITTFLAALVIEIITGAGQDFQTGLNNAITDVPGIKVGHFTNEQYLTGTTVILAPPEGATGGVEVRGSAPGTVETDLLNPLNLVEKVNAIVLSGGSAYGLEARTGVMRCLEEQGVGFPVGAGRVVPIVPGAILFDLGRGGDWTVRPTAQYGYEACRNATDGPVGQGNVGAGAGAVSGWAEGLVLKSGIGTASVNLGNGVIVGAIVAVNAFGSTVNPKTGDFYAKYLEIGGEFRLQSLSAIPAPADQGSITYDDLMSKCTTIGVVATNVKLTKAQVTKVAQMAHDGLARAIRPAHTMFDGDTIFALATGEIELAGLTGKGVFGTSEAAALNVIGSAAADTFARAIIHAMLSAESVANFVSYCDYYSGVCSK
ncbi:MAG: P1 family peptidase [Candidatus Bathyarchaeia archaeon]